uniref:Cytochrome P450 n=1 Tax=Pristionchus pacificus TaxID=54126 RepID=A0A8R1Y8P0_PRIPA
MFAVPFLLVSLIFLIHRYYSARNRYWSDRGVPGPEPELLFGNLRAIWAYDRPRALVLKEWTKQFGKVYGYLSGQRPMWVISDLSMVNEIFIKRFDNFYAHANTELQGEDTPNSHMAEARGAHWKRLRTLSADAFTNKAMRAILPTIKTSAREIVAHVEKQSGAEIDTQRYLREYTMDIICKSVLGMDNCKMFENKMVVWSSEFFLKPLSYWVFSLASLFPALRPVWKISFVASSLFIDVPLLPLIRDIRKIVQERKKRKDAGEPSKDDIIGMFLDAESNEVDAEGKGKNKLSIDEIVANCKLFLLAGYDTTSITVSRVIHFLANNPNIQNRLMEEVDDVIGNEDYDLEDIGNLSYMDAVIKETLRHHPLGSGFTTRECTEACEIGGYRFEEGDSIIADTWSLQMDEEIWGDDEEEFRPERWLEDATVDRAAFLAFGGGPRICIGMKQALIESKVVLIELMKKFTIEATENTNPLKMVGTFLVAFEHVNVSMKKR